MSNPYVITIHCDGAMDYDSRQTGGNGFVIDFPDSMEVDPIMGSFRNDNQGIQRLEMISIIEAMKKLLRFAKQNPGLLRKVSGVCIFTDRFRVTDGGLTNPYRIQGYRKNKWKNHEGKPIKDREILDELDKLRTKLSKEVGGRVEIKYKREKNNRVADKLSKLGKKYADSRRIIRKNKNVSPKKFDGEEVVYSLISVGDVFCIHVYAWERVQNQIELSVEIIEGRHLGKKLRVYVDLIEKSQIHRRHFYRITVSEVFKYYIRATGFEEIKGV